ncbi:MAG: TolC family protein [Bacteroidetes bacterium]|nr:TolC family protein [Bacteroidota bacterium]
MKYFLIILLIFSGINSKAQDTTTIKWSLQECINYALANNIQVKKTLLSNQTSDANYQQQKNNKLPSVSAGSSFNFSNGNSIDPITSNFVNQSILSNSYSVSGQVVLYQGNKLNLQIEQNKLLVDQSKLYQQQAENSIVLEVIQNYLQSLYYAEGITIAQNALTTSAEEVKQAQIKYDNGAIAQLDLADLKTQYASAQYSVVTAKNQYEQQVLVLKQLLELDPSVNFQIQPVSFSELQTVIPDKQTVFANAADSFPDLKIYDVQAEILDKALSIAKAGYKPTLSLSAGVSTGFTNSLNNKFATQLHTNLSPQAGITLSIPIFSKKQNKTNVTLAKIDIEQNKLDKIAAGKTLYTNIENAWQNAVANQSQQASAKVALDNAELSYNLARKKFEFGGLTATDLSVSRNSYLAAEQTLLQTKYLTTLYTSLLNFYQGKQNFN